MWLALIPTVSMVHNQGKGRENQRSYWESKEV